MTEEVWNGRSAEAREVAQLIERRYPCAVHSELYECVPQRLFELRGAPMLNLAKLKVAGAGSDAMFFSLSMKDIFGLIPEPDRSDYHGNDSAGLASSITGMCKIYTALFDITHAPGRSYTVTSVSNSPKARSPTSVSYPSGKETISSWIWAARAAASTRREIKAKSVLFPHAGGPITAIRSPGSQRTSTESSARWLSPRMQLTLSKASGAGYTPSNVRPMVISSGYSAMSATRIKDTLVRGKYPIISPTVRNGSKTDRARPK